MNVLPEEIILHIFTYAQNIKVSEVCSKWYAISNSVTYNELPCGYCKRRTKRETVWAFYPSRANDVVFKTYKNGIIKNATCRSPGGIWKRLGWYSDGKAKYTEERKIYPFRSGFKSVVTKLRRWHPNGKFAELRTVTTRTRWDTNGKLIEDCIRRLGVFGDRFVWENVSRRDVYDSYKKIAHVIYTKNGKRMQSKYL